MRGAGATLGRPGRWAPAAPVGRCGRLIDDGDIVNNRWGSHSAAKRHPRVPRLPRRHRRCPAAAAAAAATATVAAAAAESIEPITISSIFPLLVFSLSSGFPLSSHVVSLLLSFFFCCCCCGWRGGGKVVLLDPLGRVTGICCSALRDSWRFFRDSLMGFVRQCPSVALTYIRIFED